MNSADLQDSNLSQARAVGHLSSSLASRRSRHWNWCLLTSVALECEFNSLRFVQRPATIRALLNLAYCDWKTRQLAGSLALVMAVANRLSWNMSAKAFTKVQRPSRSTNRFLELKALTACAQLLTGQYPTANQGTPTLETLDLPLVTSDLSSSAGISPGHSRDSWSKLPHRSRAPLP